MDKSARRKSHAAVSVRQNTGREGVQENRPQALGIGEVEPRGLRHRKKICDADFFSRASLAGLTNYVIRHISKYGNIMTSFS